MARSQDYCSAVSLWRSLGIIVAHLRIIVARSRCGAVLLWRGLRIIMVWSDCGAVTIVMARSQDYFGVVLGLLWHGFSFVRNLKETCFDQLHVLRY